jgi:hypothetical protein
METPNTQSNMESDPPTSENQADIDFEKSLDIEQEDVWDNGRVIVLEDDGEI